MSRRRPPPRQPSARISVWPLSGAGFTLVTLIVVGLVVGIIVALHGSGSSGPPPFGTPLPFVSAPPSAAPVSP